MSKPILSPEVQERQRVEREIAKAVVRETLRKGFRLEIDNGGDERIRPRQDQSTLGARTRSVLKEMFQTDEERVFVFDPSGKGHGWVWFVYGEDGWDVMADYTCNLEDEGLLKAALKLVDRFMAEWVAK